MKERGYVEMQDLTSLQDIFLRRSSARPTGTAMVA